MSALDWNPRAVRRRTRRGEALPAFDQRTYEFAEQRALIGIPRDRSRRRRKQRRAPRKRPAMGHTAIDRSIGFRVD